MSGDVVTIVIVGALILAALIVAGYYLLRFLRGRIKIRLPKYAFNTGEKVTGTFDLKIRKPIEGNRLYAALIGEEEIRERRGDKTRTHRNEVFRNEQTLEQSKSFIAGWSQRYNFELSTPSAQEPDFLNSSLGKTLKMGIELLSNTRRRLQWKVVVRLDAKGIDLASKKSISVNMSDAI